MGVLFLSAAVFQCRKAGDLIKNLDRSFTGTADTTVYASFYENNTVSTADATPDVNDIIKYRGVQTILNQYCGTSNCHGGPIKPKFDSYAEIMKFVIAGDPSASKLWQYITTNDFDKAMPPVNSNFELNTTDKGIVYNWILNGAKERPDLKDFRPAAIRLITSGCGSANCHNQGTAAGSWARKGFLAPLTTTDTTQFLYINPANGTITNYCQLSNVTIRNQVWGAYKDSVRRYYADVIANASFKPFKTFANGAISTRGPLNTYDDILLDIWYPKSVRSSTVKPDFLDASSSMVSRIDSTLLVANPRTGVYATTPQGDMAFGDGGLKSNEIALIKAWYFADPNIPDVWKYGQNNAGILKYRKTGKIIKQ